MYLITVEANTAALVWRLGVLGEGVYEYVQPKTLRALHFYMGVGGADRFLCNIPVEKWEQAEKLATTHVQQFCKCEGAGCVACELINSADEVQTDGEIPDTINNDSGSELTKL